MHSVFCRRIRLGVFGTLANERCRSTGIFRPKNALRKHAYVHLLMIKPTELWIDHRRNFDNTFEGIRETDSCGAMPSNFPFNSLVKTSQYRVHIKLNYKNK